MNHHRTKTSRHGFTLLEVIIASSLAATLMLLVWSLFSVYSKLYDKGVQQATELQLVRSVMRQLRSDLHHASAALMPTRDVFATVPSDGSALVSDREIADHIPLPSGAQLLGTSTRLQMVLRASSRANMHQPSLQTAIDEFTTPAVYELVEYVWYPRSDSLTRGSEVLEEYELGQESTDVERAPGAVGLTRRATPWFLQNSERASDRPSEYAGSIDPRSETSLAVNPGTESLRPPAWREDAVPEVARLQFRYFDGTSWLGHWDSGQAGRFPVAIEIAFDLQPEEQPDDELADEHLDGEFVDEAALVDVKRDLAGGSAAGEYEHEYRFVIAVETATPRLARAEVVVP
ncbi:MAG: prepilin-type N-terminal cleavage/methylation domain-containing protein [Planctomycetia bacterium]|nr:prepilin-type N-terminal cleavage/methylation domain-containing protein [Planctomycetia bacterium]